jgi:hypothetical protein
MLLAVLHLMETGDLRKHTSGVAIKALKQNPVMQATE